MIKFLQGTASDVIKVAMLEVESVLDALKNNRSVTLQIPDDDDGLAGHDAFGSIVASAVPDARLVMQIHDELIYELHDSEIDNGHTTINVKYLVVNSDCDSSVVRGFEASVLLSGSSRANTKYLNNLVVTSQMLTSLETFVPILKTCMQKVVAKKFNITVPLIVNTQVSLLQAYFYLLIVYDSTYRFTVVPCIFFTHFGVHYF